MKSILQKIFFVCIFGGALFLQGSEVILANHFFSRHLYSWRTPEYWAGKTSLITENGTKYLQLVSGKRGNEVFGRALSYPRQVGYYADDIIQIELKAKGEGILQAGILIYSFKARIPEYIRCPEQTLTSDFQNYSWKIIIPRHLRMILPFMEVKGQGKIIASSYKLKTKSAKGVSVKTVTSLQVLGPQSKTEPVKFQSTLKNTQITVCQKLNKDVTEVKTKTDADGNLTVLPEVKNPGLTEITASAKGVHASAYIYRETAENFKSTQALAQKIKLPRPLRILMIGDSLSDFYRGYNYLDRLNFWLNQYNPGKISIRNAGVRGDYVTRVEERFNGTLPTAKHKAYCQEMYNGLFSQTYDMIFIFLGQNDTRCWRKENFSKPLIDPATQEKTLHSIMKFIRKQSQAKIILISPSPGNIKIFTDRAAKMKKGQNMVMYGKKEFVDAYDAVNRKFCREQKLDYIDILTPMRNSKDIASLYVNDGVHLSPAGGRLIADELLKYLINQKF